MSTALSEGRPLTLLRLQPDMTLLARWALASGQRALRDDTGYALHAALHAVLGALAPQPFMLRPRSGTFELLGYVNAEPDALQRALQLPAADVDAAQALCVDTARCTAMPADWRCGERLSFETRVAPVVRSRQVRPGAVVEVDAAWHPSMADPPGDRQQAYGRWLARELARDGAATLQAWSTLALTQLPIARRHARPAAAAGAGRGLSQGLLPDLRARGELTLDDPAAFARLLARGLGRHRAFGFGCLLLAPAGALHAGA